MRRAVQAFIAGVRRCDVPLQPRDRHAYRLVEGGPQLPLFPDLVGFGPPSLPLDLAQVFDVPGHPPQLGKRLDGRLPPSLIGLPEQVTGVIDTCCSVLGGA